MGAKNSVPGRFVRGQGGYQAFVPDPLPPPIAWTGNLARILSEADRAIGQLAGEGRRLPNPHLLIRPFLRMEAVQSSRIEGTQATLGEILAVEAGASVDRSPADLKEVGNYVTALEHGRSLLGTLPLSLRLVRELHEKLMRGVRGNMATPGEFRRSQNWIGPAGCTLNDATYVPPPPDEMMPALGEWEKFLHDRTLPPLIQAGLIHYQFEAIHPFLDGNGRVGRLLIILFLMEREVLPDPVLYLSAFFDATRPDYYSRLTGVSKSGEWREWLEYFLRGVAVQSVDALGRAERLNAIVEDWKKKIAGTTAKVLPRVLERLAANPFLVTKKTAVDLGVAYSTVQRTVDLLEKKSILRQVGESRRDRVYCAKAFLDVLEEPPHLPGKG